MHVFLSYARADEEIVQPLSTVLCAAGLRPWLDTSGLPPGTPQWDRMVRSALQDAHAVVIICSEHSRDSEYVAIELEIARGYRKIILPVWVSGEEWSQSAPVALVLSQYIDLRRGCRRSGVADLVLALKRHLAVLPVPAMSSIKWPFVRVEWGDKHLHLNPFSHKDWGELLSEVYLSLLKDHFPPFSYGDAWTLEISGATNAFQFGTWPLFALPASWAAIPFTGVHKVDLGWVHSPADCELASIIQDASEHGHRDSVRRRHYLLRSKVRVIDLRTLPQISHEMLRYEHRWDEFNPANNFIGLRCRCRTFWSFATGGHPKMTVMRLSGQRRTRDFVSQAFEYFEMPEPRLQAVTIRNDLFDRSLAWQLIEDVSEQSDNIIEFK